MGARVIRYSFAVLSLLSFGTATAQAQSERPVGFQTRCYVITKARLIPQPGTVIDPGTLVIRNGLIAALGESNNVETPADAEVIDGTGLIVYAGFLDAATNELLDPESKPTGAPGRTHDFARHALAATAADHRHSLTPEYLAAENLKPKDDVLESFRQHGFVAVNVMPESRIAAGQGTLVALSGNPLRETLLAKSTLQSLQLYGPGGRVYPATLMGATAHLRQAFLDAERHALHGRLFESHATPLPRPPLDLAWNTLEDVRTGKGRAAFFVTTRDDIHRALDFAAENHFKPVLWGARDAARAIERLAEVKPDVLLTLDLGDEPKVEASEQDSAWDTVESSRLKVEGQKTERNPIATAEIPGKPAASEPSTISHQPSAILKADVKDPGAVQEHRRAEWRERAATAARLREKGVKFAFTSRGLKNRPDVMKGVRNIVKAGLAPDEALAALTTHAAEILGTGDRLGRLEVGRPAFVTVMTGALENDQAKVRHVFVDDRKFDYNKDAKPVTNTPSATPAAPAPSVAGTWAVDIESATGKVAAQLTLAQDGGKLTGAFTSEQGNGRLTAGTLKETTLDFTVGIGAGERTVELKFHGKLSDGKLAGELKPAFGAVTKWTATRVEKSDFTSNPVKLELDGPFEAVTEKKDGGRGTGGQGASPAGVRSASKDDAAEAEIPTTAATPKVSSPAISPSLNPSVASSPPAPLPPSPHPRKGFPVELPSDRTRFPWRTGGNVLIKNATVLTSTNENPLAQTLKNTSILVRDGKFAAIGPDLAAEPGVRVIDAGGRYVMPGIIDTHSHIMITQGINEATQSIVCEVRIKDVLNTDDVSEYRALAGGVTTARLFHGSANVIGGQDAVVKLKHGGTAAEHLVPRAPQGVKFALGENVKFQSARFPNTRLGVEATLNRAFLEAVDYRRQWQEYEKAVKKDGGSKEQGGRGTGGQGGIEKTSVASGSSNTLTDSAKQSPPRPIPPSPHPLLPPRRDLRLEALADIVNHQKFIHSHCYRSDEILMLLNVAQNLGIRVWSLQHVLEGYKVAPEIVAHGASCSTFADWWAYKVEAFDAIPSNAALLSEAGANVVIKSDDWELIRHLYHEASKTLRYGNLPPEKALATITLNPARELGLADRLGSIEVGKDADFAIFNGHPFNVFARCEMTFIEGELYFSRADAPSAEVRVVGGRSDIKDGGRGTGGQGETERSASSPERSSTPTDSAKPSPPAPLPPSPPLSWSPPDAATRRPPLDAAPSPSGKYAFVGATLHPIDAPDIENGTLLVVDGKIAGLGSTVEVPPDAKTIDATGLHIYPGLIDAGTTLGLTEIGKVTETSDFAESGVFQPDLRAGIALNPDSELLPVTRIGGVTTILLRPTGGLISGQASLARLAGWTAPEMILDYTAGLQIQWPSGDTAKRQEQLSEFLREARLYDRAMIREGARGAGGQGGTEKANISTERSSTPANSAKQSPPAPLPPSPPALIPDPRHEAMRPYVRGEKPIFIEANSRKEIAEALLFAEKEKLKIIITGGTDAWKLADELKRRDVAVIVGPVMRAPVSDFDPHDAPYANAGRLHAAGVRFCFRSNNASNSRNVPFEAGMAAAHGLPEDAALRGVTLSAAEILGLADRLGSLTIGKQATFQVTDGSPLQPASQLKALHIDGRPIALESRQTKFYERYRTRLQEVQKSRNDPARVTGME